MTETLPDSGGAYLDRASGPVTGTLRRNWTNFKQTVTSGQAGAEGAKYLIGGAIAGVGYWVVNAAFDAETGD